MEFDIDLKTLTKMRRAFEEADADGSGELDEGEFIGLLGPYLLGRPVEPKDEQMLRHLFMRIDADCGGTVDWEEYTDFFFLQRSGRGTGTESEEHVLQQGSGSAASARDTEEQGKPAAHRGAVTAIATCGATDATVTCGRDGVIRVWEGPGMEPAQALHNGPAWITGCCWVGGRLAVAALDRTISFYDAWHGGLEPGGRVRLAGRLGAPRCLAPLATAGPAAAQLVSGDARGALTLVAVPAAMPAGAGGPPAEVPSVGRVLHREHTGCILQVESLSHAELLSASADGTLRLTDVERAMATGACRLHRGAVRCFAHCPATSLVASGGVGSSALLWEPRGNPNHCTGELPGHMGGVLSALSADDQRQVITLAGDHVVRLWDVRTLRCLQTLQRDDWLRPEDSQPSALHYDASRQRLVSALHGPVAWAHTPPPPADAAAPRMRAALFNSTFGVLVAGSEGGRLIVWDLASGRRQSGFMLADPGSGGRLADMRLDGAQRRLLAATDRGEVCMYNFTSGQTLRSFELKERRPLVGALAYVPLHHADRGGADAADAVPDSPGRRSSSRDAAGRRPASGRQDCAGAEMDDEPAPAPPRGVAWAAGARGLLCTWLDGEEPGPCCRLRAHRADVLCIAHCLPGLVATGDAAGAIHLWPEAAGGAPPLASLQYGGGPVQHLLWVPPPAGSGPGATPALLACGDAGCLAGWRVSVPAGATPLCAVPLGSLPALPRAGERATALALAGRLLLLGTSLGTLCAWALEAELWRSCEPARSLAGAAQPAGAWRLAPEAGISCLAVAGASSRPLVAVGDDAGGLRLWQVGDPCGSRAPRLVGAFGSDAWELGGEATWRGDEAPAAARQDSGGGGLGSSSDPGLGGRTAGTSAAAGAADGEVPPGRQLQRVLSAQRAARQAPWRVPAAAQAHSLLSMCRPATAL